MPTGNNESSIRETLLEGEPGQEEDSAFASNYNAGIANEEETLFGENTSLYRDARGFWRMGSSEDRFYAPLGLLMGAASSIVHSFSKLAQQYADFLSKPIVNDEEKQRLANIKKKYDEFNVARSLLKHTKDAVLPFAWEGLKSNPDFNGAQPCSQTLINYGQLGKYVGSLLGKLTERGYDGRGSDVSSALAEVQKTDELFAECSTKSSVFRANLEIMTGKELSEGERNGK
jgi:hypothetical protein